MDVLMSLGTDWQVASVEGQWDIGWNESLEAWRP